jgi:phosphoribosylformylglycinamidine synthase
LVPLRYVADDGMPTERYPFNPNGSTGGIAALCTKDGRHLALMPHPERTCFAWSWPWIPTELQRTVIDHPPWLQMFVNARMWCDK